MSANESGLVPLRVEMNFFFAENNVATEETTIAELIESVSEEAAVDSASDTNCDDGGCQ